LRGGFAVLVKTCVAVAKKMLGRGGIKNWICVASKTSRSRRVMGGQLETVLGSMLQLNRRLLANSRIL
jgi:hypothetical protein